MMDFVRKNQFQMWRTHLPRCELLLPLQLAVELHATWSVGRLVDSPVLCEIVPALYATARAIAPLLLLAASLELSALVRRYRRLGVGPRALLEESALAEAAVAFEKRFRQGALSAPRAAVASRKSRARWTVAIACAVAIGVNAIDAYFWRYNYQTQTCEVRPEVLEGGDGSLFRLYQWSAEGFFFVLVPLLSLLVNASSVYDVRKLSAYANDRVSDWLRRSYGVQLRTGAGAGGGPWNLQGSASLVICLSFYVTFTAVPRTVVWALASHAEQSRDLSMTEAEAAADETGWQRYLFYILVRKTLDELHLSSYTLGVLVCAFASRRVRRRLRLMLLCVNCCGGTPRRSPPPPSLQQPAAIAATPRSSPARPPRPVPPDPRLLLGTGAQSTNSSTPAQAPVALSRTPPPISSRESLFMSAGPGVPEAAGFSDTQNVLPPVAHQFVPPAPEVQVSREDAVRAPRAVGIGSVTVMPTRSCTPSASRPSRHSSPSPTFRGILRRPQQHSKHTGRSKSVSSARIGDAADAPASNPNSSLEFS